MKSRKTKSSNTVRRGNAIYSHRRPKVSFSKALYYIFSGIGNQLYYLGATVERRRKNFGRHIRHGYRRVFSAIFGVIKAVFCYIGRAIAGVWDDLTMPIRKMRRSFKSLSIVIKSAEDRGKKYRTERVRLFFRYGWLWNKQLVTRLINYLFPLASLAVAVIVITSMLNLNYALRISYNGQTVGYVSHEGVYDAARKLVQGKMLNDEDQMNWQDDTNMDIAIVGEEQLSSQDIMAENLLTAAGDIVQGTGVYIGGMFYGATTAPDLIQDKLDEMIKPFEDLVAELGDSEIIVKFARNVELIDGVFPVVSVMPYETLINNISAPTPMQIIYKAKAGEVALEIAHKNGITYSKLQELNPGVDLALIDATDLIVAQDEMLLRVKTVKQETEVRTIGFETVMIKRDDFTANQSFIKVHGQNGECLVVLEYEYKDGVRGEPIELSYEILRDPINQEVIVGTKDSGGGSGMGTNNMCWPTGDGYRVSRGFSSYHFGVDIAAAEGTSVFAADNGVVVQVIPMHWSYGNYVVIDHQNGISTLYAHNSALLVQVGQIVSRGEIIALMGSTGNSTGSHLHFEVMVNGIKMDPATYIGY